MARHSRKESLTQARKDEIAHLLATHFIRDQLRFMSNSEYRRRIGQAAQSMGGGVTAEELNAFIVDKLSLIIGDMFGWTECSIRGSEHS